MITIILPISRKDYLRPVFNCLAELEKPKDTELLIILDGSQELEQAVGKRTKQLKGFSSIRLIGFGDGPVENRNDRRYRISAIHNLAKQHVSDNCEYVFLVEDDTVYPKNTLFDLSTCMVLEKCHFIQGVELGRWKTKYIGAWLVDDVNEPKIIKSLMPALVDNLAITSYGHYKVDAGGFYCALVDADLYKQHTFEPFDKQGTNGLGCDVNFGLYLRQQSYECLTDWTIQCDHIGKTGSVNLGNTKPVRVTFSKDRKGKWSSIATED